MFFASQKLALLCVSICLLETLVSTTNQKSQDGIRKLNKRSRIWAPQESFEPVASSSEIQAGLECPAELMAMQQSGQLQAHYSSQHFNSHSQVQVDPISKKRRFESRIIGIFSCLEQASNDLTLDFRLAKPVIDLAIDAVNSKYKHIHFNVTYRTAPDICRHQQAAGHAADEFYLNGANFILGPGCSEALASVGQLASYWNVPMCSTGFLPEMVTAKFKPLTLLQLSLSVQSVGEMLLEMFELYKWRHLVILTDERHPLHTIIRDGLQEFFHTLYMRATGSPSQSNRNSSQVEPASGKISWQERTTQRLDLQQQLDQLLYYINITSRSLDYNKANELDYKQAVLDAANYSRVFLILARSSTIVNLLEAAHSLGMSGGKFVFIAHELFETQVFDSSAPTGRFNFPTAGGNKSTNASTKFTIDDKIEITPQKGNTTHERLLREIFQPLMTISLRIPTTPEFSAFRRQVAQLSESQFNYRIETRSLKSLYSLGLAAFIYDCVMLYADKVNFILEKTQYSRIDGKTIFDESAGRTFNNALTGDLTLNLAGQRVIDYTLNGFSLDTLNLEPIAHFLAIERALRFIPGRAPYWTQRNQTVPRSDPRCRQSDSFCHYLSSPEDEIEAGQGATPLVLGLWLLVALVLLVAFASTLVGWLVFRRFRIESELLNLWWSIKYEDIQFEEEQDQNCDGKRSVSSLAISTESFNETQLAKDACQAGSLGRSSPSSLTAQVALAAKQLELHTTANTCNSKLTEPPQGNLRAESQLSLGSSKHLAANREELEISVSGSSLSMQKRGVETLQLQSNKVTGSRNLAPPIGGNKSSGGQVNKASSQTKPMKPSQQQGHFKDPSISSQNKNIKLRLGTVLNANRDQPFVTKVGLYKATRVAAKHLNIRNLNINRQLLIELRQVRDLTHENLIKFIGLSPDEPNVAIVSEFCTRGNLSDLLQNQSIRLDWPFRYSIINDIVDGLQHLHSSPVGHHGRLKSSNCVIDNRFVVKLTDFGLPTLMAAIELPEELELNPRQLLWTAPEHLRTKRPLLSGSAKGDIYSLAIILQEIITRCGPFECEPILCASASAEPAGWGSGGQPLVKIVGGGGGGGSGTGTGSRGGRQQQPQMMQQSMQVIQHKQRLQPAEIVNLVRMGLSPPFRPYFRPDAISAQLTAANDFNVNDLIALVQSCWQEAPASRPSVSSVKQQIKKTRRGGHLSGANLMDNLLQRMERYTDNLESLVEQKTAELMEEKKRSEELLYEMLPRFVVDQLKYGHSVTPEAYEAVTISFSDIKDFTSIAAQSSPIEVINLLNRLYTEFDDCIARYDVYKVETIGDAYMVVSGLPIRNGDLHAKEIAEMSLALLDLIRIFEVAHLPEVNLELRIGVHSGPCASGVVGTRMFRYCLFGDTVNTASRMESHGEPMKIHISEDTANILAKFETFLIEPRGQIDIKGKGLMNTFWLTGKRCQLSLDYD